MPRFTDYGDPGSYTGDLDANGKRHGKGKMVYDSGNTYEGGFVNNKFEGDAGIYTWNGEFPLVPTLYWYPLRTSAPFPTVLSSTVFPPLPAALRRHVIPSPSPLASFRASPSSQTETNKNPNGKKENATANPSSAPPTAKSNTAST